VHLLERHAHAVFHCTSIYLSKRGFDVLRVGERGKDVSRQEVEELRRRMMDPGSRAVREMGSLYTASVYTSLASLLSSVGEGVTGERILMFSYGSRSVGTMYSLRVDRLPLLSPLQHDLDTLAGTRTKVTVKQFVQMRSLKAQSYGQAPFSPLLDRDVVAQPHYPPPADSREN
jgi:3-hydroxy-3-methylglutaryl CoA synthase